MSYGDYLGLDSLLAAQKPISGQHDEMLFITIHQVQELWLKLLLHELDLAIACLRRDELRPAFKAMARVSRIQRQLIEAWDVLSTMTPHDYLAFRAHLGSSSGFQTWRFRHMRTVERIIGYARGTGGSAGVAYLRKAIERRFFPELYEARTELS